MKGFFAVSPAAFIALNTGLSESLKRIHSDAASSSSEKTKGKRQPQSFQIATGISHLVSSTTMRLMMKPPMTLAWMKLV